jgi:hypothetical protein
MTKKAGILNLQRACGWCEHAAKDTIAIASELAG